MKLLFLVPDFTKYDGLIFVTLELRKTPHVVGTPYLLSVRDLIVTFRCKPSYNVHFMEKTTAKFEPMPMHGDMCYALCAIN